MLLREKDVGEDDGIKGILNRLEKERSFSYPEADDRLSSKNNDDDARNAGTLFWDLVDSKKFPCLGFILCSYICHMYVNIAISM